MRRTFALVTLLANLTWGQDITAAAEKAFDRADYEEAYGLFKEASEKHIQDDEPVAYVQCNLMMAECKVLLGEPSVGNEIASNTYDYLERFYPDQHIVKGQALTLQGRSYLSLGRNDLAIKHLESAQNLLGSVETLELATCLNDMGMAYLNNSNFELSIQYLERAMQIRRKLLSSKDLAIGDSFNNLGRYHQDTGNALQALVYFNRAKKIYESALGENHPKTSLVINNLAFANATQGQYDEALSLLNDARQKVNARFEGNHERKAFVILSIGRIHYFAENYNQAHVHFTEALQMYVSMFGNKHPEVANCYYLIGENYRQQGAFTDALESYQNAIYSNLTDQSFKTLYDLPQIRDYFNADILLSSLEGKALALESNHYEKSLNTRDLVTAVETYVRCDELISVIRQIRQNEGDKIKLGDISKRVYETGIRLSLTLSEQTFKKKYYLEKAFRFCERSKSAVLLEAINETNAKSFAGIPSELLDLEDSLKSEIAFFEQQLAGGREQEKFKNLLFQYQGAYQDFIARLEQEYPEYYNLKYSQEIVTTEAIVAALEVDAVLFSYFLGENQVYIFRVDRNGLKSDVHPLDKDFNATASAFRNAIKYKMDRTVISSAKKLYRQLIPKKIGKVSKMIILPDGIIGTLPFESFINPMSEGNDYAQQDFLIEHYGIAYDYSASLLVNRSKYDEGPIEKVLLCAPITFDNNETPMPALPASEDEVKEIRLFFLANGDADLVLNTEASESLMKTDALMGYKYLHFATHGQVNESKPELSRIFLAPGASEDGSLYSGEIYNLKINADLVTLSACETGLGKIAKGEGVIGLSRALQYAGAKNLIVSLWQVADKSTSDLMIKFYDQHLHNDYSGYHAALRQAKLYLLNSKEYASPFYWAPFILIGY